MNSRGIMPCHSLDNAHPTPSASPRHPRRTRRCHLLHGLRRSLRPRRPRRQGRVPPQHPHPPAHPAALVRPDRAHGRRTLERPPRGGGLLRLGQARPRPFLGLSGGLALARRQHLRHGDLPDALRQLPRPSRSFPRHWTQRADHRAGPDRRLRASGTCWAQDQSAAVRSGSAPRCSAPFAVLIFVALRQHDAPCHMLALRIRRRISSAGS